MSDLPTYVLERTFDAPVALVWRAFTEPDLLSHWYGPGVETIIHKLDVRPGGEWLNEMRWGENSNFQRAEYVVVEDRKQLVWLQSVTDADWNIASNAQMPNWPRVLHTDVSFEEISEARTRMRLIWTPHEASDAEILCFQGALPNLDQGWGKGMELLAEMLAELQSS